MHGEGQLLILLRNLINMNLLLADPGTGERFLRLLPKKLAKLEAIVASYEGQFRHAATFRLLNNIRKEYPFLRIYFKSDRKNQMKLVKCPRFWFLLNQYRWFSVQYKKAVMFFQIGCFYEFFNWRAKDSRKLFGLKTNKPRKGLGMRCGFHKKCLWGAAKIAAKARLPFVIVHEEEGIADGIKQRKASLYYSPNNHISKRGPFSKA